jgi:hypothetical protein
MDRIVATVLAVLVFAAQSFAQPPVSADYVVVDFCGANDPYHKASERLAELRHATIVDADPQNLDPVMDSLRKHTPQYVAFVVRPDQFDENLARSILQLATQIDDDPFVDFSYSFITGDSPESAVALVESARAAEKRQSKPELAVVAVGEKMITKSSVASQRFSLRKTSFPQLWGQIAGGENFPKDGRDTEFIKTLMPKIQGKPIIILGGHGYPREVVGGPNWKDFEGIHLDGSVVLNIACYTGVTGTWYEDDWATGVIKKQSVPAAESLCLNILKSGVTAYVAYACARPAGPELFSDVGAMAGEGLSVGEIRRRDYNRVVLAHLAQGFDGLRFPKIEDGQPIQPRQNIVKDLLLNMATGGVLFGDPAFKPFPAKAGESPLDIRTQRTANQLEITMQVAPQHLFFECGEQLDTWDNNQSPAMRLVTRVPLGQSYVTQVQVKELKIGKNVQPNRLVWGVEEDRGERYLHVKAVFPQSINGMLGVKANVEATLTDDPRHARRNSIKVNPDR